LQFSHASGFVYDLISSHNGHMASGVFLSGNRSRQA